MSSLIRPLIFNGKFYLGEMNGVHRVAHQLIRQVDQILAAMPEHGRPHASIIVPGRRTWSPDVGTIRVVEDQRARSQLWEQTVLPYKAAGAVLISLCNLAPIAHRRKLTMVHDAQFLFSDSSYPPRQRLGYKVMIPLMARSSAHVLTVSEYSRQILDVTNVVGSERSSVIHNGVDHMLQTIAAPAILDRYAILPRKYVITFGSAKKYKNLAILFEAFRHLELADLKLVIVGDGENILRAGGLDPPGGTIFAGRIDDADLRALYEAALCLAFPSRTEGFGLPPVEAMLVGCPAIVAPAGAMPEICRDAVLYAGVDDAGEWVTAIRRMTDDSDLRTAKIEAGRVRASLFTWQAAGAKLLEAAMKLAAD